MKNIRIVFLLLILLSQITFGYDYLYVQDPQNWRSSQGSIDEAVLSIKPKGIYMEYGLYLTFSAKNSWYGFNHNDTLEVQFKFDLPDGAIVDDMWLWVGNDIIKAKIMDKWTASSIYENIVKRRRDPAILYKQYGNSYELRIFPMAGDETRKVKITYLVPAQWSSKTVTAPLPTNLLRTSYSPIPKFRVLFWPNETWKNPGISEFPETAFKPYEDTTFGVYHGTSLDWQQVNNSLSFEVDSPLKNGLFFSRYAKGGNGYYQLAMLPNESFGLNSARKVAILVDYDASKSQITAATIIASLKALLKSYFTQKDSFNLIFSNLEIKRAREDWICADSASIEQAFDSLGSNPISSYSNLTSLFNSGIDFVNKHGKDAAILLISNSDQVGNYTVANPLINDLKTKMEVIYPVYVVDFMESSSNWYYLNGRYYTGNEYFLENISRITYGEYINTRGGLTFPLAVSNSLQALSGFISSFDFYTTMQEGYCFGRYNTGNSGAVYLNKALTQVGKFSGTMPFIIQASGVFKSETFTKSIKVEEKDICSADSVVEQMWAGNLIRSLEAQQQTNTIINEIVDNSLSSRVLSYYTALLALEPSDSVKVCYDCIDESDISSVEEDNVLPVDFEVTAYPNPFNAQVTLKVNIPADINTGDITFKIYNILGEVVKTFETEVKANGKYEFSWNGINDYGEPVASGIYLFVVQTAAKNYSLKIVLMK